MKVHMCCNKPIQNSLVLMRSKRHLKYGIWGIVMFHGYVECRCFSNCQTWLYIWLLDWDNQLNVNIYCIPALKTIFSIKKMKNNIFEFNSKIQMFIKTFMKWLLIYAIFVIRVIEKGHYIHWLFVMKFEIKITKKNVKSPRGHPRPRTLCPRSCPWPRTFSPRPWPRNLWSR